MNFNPEPIIKSLIDEHQLSDHQEDLNAIVQDIYVNGISITLCKDQKASQYLSPSKYFDYPQIWLGLSGKRRPVEILWSLLHEFGHHFDTALNTNMMHDVEYVFDREAKAWLYAERRLHEFSSINLPEEFAKYKDDLLSTYKK